MGDERADCHRAEGSVKLWVDRGRGFPGTPVEWQKASSRRGSPAPRCKKVRPQARYTLSESRPAVTLSFGDAMQLERLTMVTLMAFKLPLKMWKLRRLNNSRRSICEACHSASRSHHSAPVCVAEVLREGRKTREAWGPHEKLGSGAMWRHPPFGKSDTGFENNWLPVENWNKLAQDAVVSTVTSQQLTAGVGSQASLCDWVWVYSHSPNTRSLDELITVNWL